MNIKKVIVIVVVIVLCILGVLFIPVKEKLTLDETLQLLNDAHIDILVDMGTYLKEQPHNQAVQEAAIRIANEIKLLDYEQKKSSNEYLTSENFKKIVTELTGVTLTTPIVVDDYKEYYSYNDKFDIYEIIPVDIDWLYVSEVKDIQKEGNIYRLDCVARTEAGDQYVESVKIELEYKPKNEIIKYQINSITSTERKVNLDNDNNVE